MRHLCTIVAIACICGGCAAESVTPSLQQGEEDNWLFAEGEWRMEDGVLTQQTTAGGGRAVMVHPAFSDFELSAELMIHPEGNGVRAAALILRATGTMTCYWVHLDSKNDNVIAVRSTPGNTWDELGRTPFTIEDDQWHSVRARCQGPEITVWLDDTEVLTCEDESIAAGYVGLGTSQGRVSFRNLQVEGTVTEMGELRSETPPYMRISLGEASGSYQAFPDVCRLQSGDLLCVFYAGYGHVSVPNDDFPRGGRVCMVRSSDEGRTWTEPEVLHDSPLDDRDPHIAQISDGTLICSFFTYDPQPDGHVDIAVTIVRSTDGGETWESDGDVLLEGFACSAPVREMPDATLLLGVYQEERDGLAYGGVIRSEDGGQTWSEPIPIGREAALDGWYLDAETDVILRTDGSLYAALRSSRQNMGYATSQDLGKTWSEVRDIGFKGHAPHLYRLSTGEVLLTHRVPNTAMHVSRDDCRTWEGPYIIDTVGGAYPSTVELEDGTILCIYYEEGAGSAIRAQRFRLTDEGIEPLPLE